jgi:DNA-binding CsgD family transcriptional regulator
VLTANGRLYDRETSPARSRPAPFLAERVQYGHRAMATIVGRQAELGEVGRFLETLAHGSAALVFEGEAGIGKTRVWEESVRRAADTGVRVVAASPAGAEVQLSFAALGDLLHGVVDEALPGIAAPQRRALEAALLLADADGEPADARAVALAFLSVLRLLATREPLVVAVDDLQWLDLPTAATLRFAFRRLESEPVGLLATVRASPGSPLPLELDRAIAAERLRRVPLSALSHGALHELLRSRLGLNLPRRTLVRVAETSQGNPFYALEIGRELQRRGVWPAASAPLPIPDNLGELIRQRIVRLPRRTRRLVVTAAAVPRATVNVLEASSGDAAQVRADLDRAVRAGVLELEAERVRFTHPLLAAVAYAEAAPATRREVHESLARAASDREERARHLALAGVGASEEIALALEDAAREARQRGAPDSAAELCEQAVALTQPNRRSDRARRTLAAAEHRFVGGDTVRARELIEGTLPTLAAGSAKARALLLLAKIEHEAGGAEPVEVSERALREPIDDPALEAALHVSIASFAENDNRRRALHARKALELLADQEDPDPALLSSALVAHALAEYYVGRGLRRDLLERAVDLEPASERPRAAWMADAVFGQLLKYTDDYEAARRKLEAAYHRALEEGDESSLPDVAAHLSELELWTGDWPAADRYARESFEAAERAGHKLWRAIGFYGRALVDAHLGRTDSARAFAEQGLALGREWRHPWIEGISLWVLGFLDLSLGDVEAVERHLARAEEIAEMIGLVEPGQWRFHPDRIEALIQRGMHDEAEALLERYESRAQAVQRPFALAAAGRCRGLLAAARGDLDGGLAMLTRSLERYGSLPLPFERARTVLALGTVERRAQRKRAARETLEQALDAFDQLGAPLWSAKAKGELGRIGGRRAPSRGALTETEAQIAELAAAGRTNAEIAAELVISPKTVKWNLSKVYGKLGVRSRTELAVALASRPELVGSGPARE